MLGEKSGSLVCMMVRYNEKRSIFRVITNRNKDTQKQNILENVETGSIIYTKSWRGYNFVSINNDTVLHTQEIKATRISYKKIVSDP